MTIEDVRLSTADGKALFGQLFLPEDCAVKGSILVSAGTGFPLRVYSRFAAWMAQRGLAVLCYDYRGIGKSSPESLYDSGLRYSDWGRYDQAACTRWLKARFSHLPLFHVGHSVGGHFSGLVEHHALVERHAFVASGTGFIGDHPWSFRPSAAMLWFGSGALNVAINGYLKSGWFWRGESLPANVWRDWRTWCLSADFMGPSIARGDLHPHYFAQVTTPIHSFVLSDDPIATPKTAQKVLDMYLNAPSEMSLFEPQDFGRKAVGHGGGFRQGCEPLWQSVLDWFEAA